MLCAQAFVEFNPHAIPPSGDYDDDDYDDDDYDDEDDEDEVEEMDPATLNELFFNYHFFGSRAEAHAVVEQTTRSTGASEATMDALPSVNLTAEHVASEPECAICNEDFTVGELCLELGCKHHYHRHCIVDWLARQSSCPVCRWQLPEISAPPSSARQTADTPPVAGENGPADGQLVAGLGAGFFGGLVSSQRQPSANGSRGGWGGGNGHGDGGGSARPSGVPPLTALPGGGGGASAIPAAARGGSSGGRGGGGGDRGGDGEGGRAGGGGGHLFAFGLPSPERSGHQHGGTAGAGGAAAWSVTGGGRDDGSSGRSPGRVGAAAAGGGGSGRSGWWGGESRVADATGSRLAGRPADWLAGK